MANAENTKHMIHLMWKKQSFNFPVTSTDSLYQLKELVFERTGVLPEHQTLLFKTSDKVFKGNLKKLNAKEVFLSSIINTSKAELSLKMIGKQRTQNKPSALIKTLEQEYYSLTIYNDMEEETELKEKESKTIRKYKGRRKFLLANSKDQNLSGHVDAATKLNLKIENLPINLMNPPRQGKWLLVLDLDKTLLHFSSNMTRQQNIQDQLRPYLFEFLSRMYKYFDLAIWSQTHYQYIEIKLLELGFLEPPLDLKGKPAAEGGYTYDYKFCFALNTEHMFKVHAREYKARVGGTRFKESTEQHVKPLHFIWNQVDEKIQGKWNKSNTIHIDDIARNFILNPDNGLLCDPYTMKRKEKDNFHLKKIADYLEHIVLHYKSASAVNHSNWKQILFDFQQNEDNL
eukprot:snap_masked-scaffold_4-processed-gene-12.36-mRNA-1 protein AED:0.39 eAED:0.39 QI:0/-1/0/1/-1/1/1/0/399